MAKITKWLVGVYFVLSVGVGSALASEPTLHEVYQAAASGNLPAAQKMMEQVLKDHPNSAKAHFVEAELVAKQGDVSKARAELQLAEGLKPDLSFATPVAVAELKTKLYPAVSSTHVVQQMPMQPHSNEIPWAMILLVVVGIAAAFFILRLRQQSAVIPAPVQGYGGANGYPVPTPAGGSAYAPAQQAGGFGQPQVGSGMGSSILGSLATGAAVGAGVVAGEALMHRVMGDGRRDEGVAAGSRPDYVQSDVRAPDRNYDMGGNDFGVADASGWDDSAEGSNSDWT